MKYIDRGAIQKAQPLLLRVADMNNPHEELRLAGEVNLIILDSKGSGDLRPMEGFLETYPERAPFIEAVKHAAPFNLGLHHNRMEEHVVKAAESVRLGQMPLEKALERASKKLKRFYTQ